MLRLFLAALVCAMSVLADAQEIANERATEAMVVEVDGVALGATPSARLSVRSLEGTSDRSIFLLDVGGVTPVPLTAGRWLVEPIVDGYWSYERLVEVTKGARNSVTVRVWPSALVEGKFAIPKGVEPPSSLSLQLSHAEGVKTEVPDDVAANCRLSADGGWNCAVPQGVFDVVMRPHGFVPVYRWNTTFDGTRPLNVGTISIKPGSSLSGFVSTPTVERLELRLRPLVLGSAGAAAKEKLSKPAAIVRPTAKGFFHFTDVSPGFWVIDTWAPGYAVTTNGPYEIHEGAETSLRDRLVLSRPGGMDLTVTPPVDPLGKPWRVSLRLMQQDGAGVLESAVDDTADPAGRLALHGKQPGKYLVSVADSRGNRIAEDTQIVESERTTFAVVAIDYVRVRGQVSIGDEPLAARLAFGGRFGILTTELRSDEKGSFEGAIPKDGEWPITIEAVDGTISTRVTRNIVAGDDGEATLTIALPNTKASGVVVDQTGKPVRGASVDLLTRTEHLTVRSAEDGSFTFQCFPTGQVRVHAEHARGTSPPEEFEADETTRREGIRLTLGTTREVTGRISSEGRPVVGAIIRFALDSGGTVVKARSDMDGSYKVEVSDQAVGASVHVSPPGYAYAARIVPRLGATYDVQIERAMGTLQVVFPEIPPSEERPEFYLRHAGVTLPFGALAEWARGHGAEFFKNDLATIPALETGTWEACKRVGALEECDRVTLANAGTAVLKMPVLTPKREGN